MEYSKQPYRHQIQEIKTVIEVLFLVHPSALFTLFAMMAHLRLLLNSM